ncbi:hypothetical protein DM02DRAFT_660670 [Periconia macrospinosa]|uniref:Uncharacterized protein n=1 Tax=Periconia macrospinosa TaxID=97972 RepID=A0A2V1D9S1_9PLEO|nr:hypothetical protein DM02DRAFT_660670 [Periconia macrospinosa]
MAATSEGGGALASDWYEKLFDSGMFSDVTLLYGEANGTHHHECKVHSTVLLSKCDWFADKWNIIIGNEKSSKSWKPTSQSIIVPGIPEELGRWFSHFKECKGHDIKIEHCTSWCLLLSMIKFCYTQNYHDCFCFSCETPRTPRHRSARHILMYALGQQYGVKDIFPHATKGFKDEIKKLRNVENNEIIMRRINLIFKLFKDDENNMLRAEALEEARWVASTTLSKQWLLQREQEFKELMPIASRYLFEDNSMIRELLKPAGFSEAKVPACYRCFDPLETPDQMSNFKRCLCKRCKKNPHKGAKGYSLALWQCQRCLVRWTCEGTRTRAELLNKCPCCQVLEMERRPPLESIEWECKKCGTLWDTFSIKPRYTEELNECICCPLETD